jgi:hypothetical protein
LYSSDANVAFDLHPVKINQNQPESKRRKRSIDNHHAIFKRQLNAENSRIGDDFLFPPNFQNQQAQ